MTTPESGARRRRTFTSSFGAGRREGHDATAFYSRFGSPLISADEHINPVSPQIADQIFCRDSRWMPEVPDSSVALVVTSPPYFVGKEYERDLVGGHVPSSYLDYITMLEDVFAECVRTLEPGGRIAVNVANLGRKPYRSLSADIITILQDKLRLLLRGEVIWQKALGSAGSCAWGSFQRPSNPVLRDVTERVVVASKGRFSRAISPAARRASGLPSVPSLSKDEFMEATTDVWHIPAESASRVGHPAPFPVALPLRLIHLYTYENDLVLDPFMGSGTTAVAAVRSERKFIGYETDPSYVELSSARLAAEKSKALSRATWQAGPSVKEFAQDLLARTGFRAVETDLVVSGVDVSFRATDAGGPGWLFDIAGSFSASGMPGLNRADVLWKVLGKAAVLREVAPQVRFGVLVTGLPPGNSAAAGALAAVCGPGKPIAAVVDLTSEAALEQLSALSGSFSR